jgi:hypothetical protein
MTIRTTRSRLTLAEPFVLKAVDGVQPAGPYEIETDEESLDAHSRLAHRRLATFIHIHRDGVSQVVKLDADELSQLLLGGVMIPLD